MNIWANYSWWNHTGFGFDRRRTFQKCDFAYGTFGESDTIASRLRDEHAFQLGDHLSIELEEA